MDDKLMYMFNDKEFNYSFCRLKLLVKKFETNQSKLKYPKFLNKRIRKHNNKTLGTSVIYRLKTSPPYLVVNSKHMHAIQQNEKKRAFSQI